MELNYPKTTNHSVRRRIVFPSPNLDRDHLFPILNSITVLEIKDSENTPKVSQDLPLAWESRKITGITLKPSRSL